FLSLILYVPSSLSVFSSSVLHRALHSFPTRRSSDLFCLAGAVAVFDGDRITASTKRLAWGGVLFGFAGAVEAWAIVPEQDTAPRSEEHTSELQSPDHLVCRLLLEKKKRKTNQLNTLD